MTFLALALVLGSAGIHATWNYAAKSARGGAVFAWLTTALTSVIFLPLAVGVLLVEHPMLTPVQIAWAAGSALFQVAYFVLLYRGYAIGDLSLVYPLARGTGPMLATIGAIVLFAERPTALALCGTLLIGLGVFVLAGDPRKLRQSGSGRAVVYALATGVMIATYTLWDKHGVTDLHTQPVIYNYVTSVTMMLLLLPVALRNRETVRFHWMEHRRQALIVGIFSPLAYIMVLTALSFSPVSYIAPAREISILIGSLLGTRVLAEGQSRRRVAAAVIMVAGVMALALG